MSRQVVIGYGIDFFAMYNPDALFQRSDRVAMEAEFSLHAGVSTDGKPKISGPLILLGIICRKAFEVIDAIRNDGETEFWSEYIRDQ